MKPDKGFMSKKEHNPVKEKEDYMKSYRGKIDTRCPYCVWAGNVIHRMCCSCRSKQMGFIPWNK